VSSDPASVGGLTFDKTGLIEGAASEGAALLTTNARGITGEVGLDEGSADGGNRNGVSAAGVSPGRRTPRLVSTGVKDCKPVQGTRNWSSEPSKGNSKLVPGFGAGLNTATHALASEHSKESRKKHVPSVHIEESSLQHRGTSLEVDGAHHLQHPFEQAHKRQICHYH
jgi:hypothetical protein